MDTDFETASVMETTAEGETGMKRIHKPKPQTRRPRPEFEPLVDKLDLLTVLGLR
ncbi:MAG: hypothetical protein ACRDTT_18460 [Pseudonocardiaceae bacterium]